MICSGLNERLMWRDISIVVADLAARKYRSRGICGLLGLTSHEINGVLNPSGPYRALIIKRQYGMIDPTENEIAAIQAASQPAGEYLESLGRTDLAALEEAEWLTFLEVVVTAYLDKMRSLEQGPELPLA